VQLATNLPRRSVEEILIQAAGRAVEPIKELYADRTRGPLMATANSNERPPTAAELRLSALSRRAFLWRTTLTAAAVGVAGSVPGVSSLIAGGSAEAPALEGDVVGAESDAAGLSDPLVAHVTDLSSGEISLFQGEREVIIHDSGLARRLAASARP
jgi:hypothetical protein